MKIKKYKLILTFLLISLIFVGLKYSIKSSSAQDQSISDAIAIRVLPNPEHYGIETWYKKQGFLGSPQSLIVDGYEAIRDGRTVYVAASNVDTSGKIIYTNIYLISYNQEVQNETIDILGQIVSNWSFNKNISSLTNNENIGHCSISTITCFSDEDCPSGLVCGNGDNYLFQKNKCVVEEGGDGEFNNTKKCLTDSECNPGFYCSSLKSRITRDVIRLGRLADISSYIEEYNYINGSYPTLRAGSYIPNFSLSVWPSWTNVLATDTGFNPNLIDPINSLGSCVKDNDPIKYDLETCWDDKTPKFYDDNLNNGLDLPINSFIYLYKGESDGSEYILCGNMEMDKDLYTFSGDISSSQDFCDAEMRYGQINENNKPVLVGYNLEGEAGKVFSGEIEVIDPDGQILNWSISPVSNFSSWQGGVMPSLVSTNNPNKRILYSESAGAAGEYKVNLTVSDGGGDPLQEELTIKITDQAPQIQAEDADYIFKDESSVLNYTAYIYDDNLLPIDNENPLAYSLVTTYPSDFPNPKSDTSKYGDFNIGHGFFHEMIKVADNKYKLEITGLLGDTDSDLEIEENADDLKLGSPTPDVIEFRLDVEDQSGLTTSKNFSINILHDAPIFNIDCPDTLRISNSSLGYINQYNCYIELENQTEGTNISFTHDIFNPDTGEYETGNNPLPINFEFNENSGLFSGYTLADRDYRIHVIATNEAGVSSEESFGIKVNDYCGDGFMQSPNDELKGGVYNDGFEQCDHDKGLATSFQDSYDNDKYYKCTTFLNTLFPLPTGSCIFNTEAGKCGDGVVQEETSIGEAEQCDFGVNNLCCNNCEWDLSNVSTTDKLSLGFIESISSIEELEKIKLDIGASAYLKTPDVVYVGEDGLFDIDIIPEGTITAMQFLLEKSSYSYASKPSEKPDAIQRAKLMLAGVDENNEISDEFSSFLYKMHSRFEDEFLVNFLYFAESPNAGKFLVGPGDGEASNFCDIRESWCYDKSVEEVLDCADDSIGSPDIYEAMNYANGVFGNLVNPESYSKSVVFFGSGLNTGSNTGLTSLLNTMEEKDIRFYTIFLPNKFSDCSSNDRNENMCKWSSEWRDGVSVFGADCSQNCCSDFNSNCSNRDYNYINPYNGGETGTDWDQIVESIVSKINYNSVIYPDSVNVFGQNIKVITPDNSGENIIIEDRNFNIYDLSSNFSCNPSSVTCSPDQLLVSPIITGDGGAIELKNVRVNVLENLSACEGEIGDGGTGSGPGTGDNNGGVYYIN
ncbi:hypothetical protein EOL94_03025 [bacterium]|nr:hypothetical protein [bacterium]